MKLYDKNFASMDVKPGVFKIKNIKFMVLIRRISDIVSGVSDKFNFIHCWAMFSENNDDESISISKECSQNSV